MKQLVTRLTGHKGSLKAELTHGVTGSFALTVGNMALRLAIGVLLARVLGVDGYGAYAFVFALVGLLQAPTQFGVPQLITREVAAFREKGEWGLLRGLLTRANQGVGLLATGTALVALAVTLILMKIGKFPQGAAFAAALPWLIIVALSAVRCATLRGLRHVVLAQLPESLIQPTVMMATLAIGYLVAGVGFLDAQQAVWLNVGTMALAFTVGVVMLVRKMPSELAGREPEYRTRKWVRMALPFMVLHGLDTVNSYLTLVMLGLMRTDAEVGIYQVCLTTALPVMFGLRAGTATVLPHLTRLWVRKEMMTLQRVAEGSVRVALMVAVPLALVLVFFGGPLLGFFFGDEFRAGSTALLVIALAQLVNAAFGSVGAILNMTGHTRAALHGMIATVVLNVVLNVLLIPPLGIEGAAISTLATFVAWNLIYFVLVRRKVGVVSFAIGGKRWGPKAEQG